MENLPSHLLDEIILRLPHKSLAKLKCANRAFRSYISDPEFKSEYYSRVGSGLLHVSSSGSDYLWYLPFVSCGSASRKAKAYMPVECQILGSLGGLVLMFMNELCVVNPITKQFRFIDHRKSEVFSQMTVHNRGMIHWESAMQIGFAVEEIDRSSQRFKIVCIGGESRTANPDESTYKFEIHDGGSWRKSRTRIASSASNLCSNVKPGYFNGSLHWLRTDGSIIAFNPDNEQARIIHTKFPAQKSGSKMWFGAVDRLTLVLATEETISIFALRDLGMLADWEMVKEIKNSVLKKGDWIYWNVATYDGKFLVVQETKEKGYSRMLYVSDVVAEKWKVLGTMPTWADSRRDFICFVPSWSSVRGLKDWPVQRQRQQPQRRISQFVDDLSVFIGLFDRICR